MHLSDRIAPIFLILIAALLYIQTNEIAKEAVPGEISPATFPRVIIVALIICALMQIFIVKSVKIQFESLWRSLAGILLVVLYIWFIEQIGYFIVTPIFLVIFPALLGYRNWKWIICLSLGSSLLFYFVFSQLLGVPLPSNFLDSMGG